MANPFISAQEQGIVVFRVWKSLPYPKRIGLSFGLILAGLIIQYFMVALLPGAILIFCGNLFLIVRGYDNRIKTGKFDAEADWEKVKQSKFYEVERLHRDIMKWDRSVLDVTNKLGLVVLVVISAVIFILYKQGESTADNTLIIIAWDAGLLLIPHWLTGIRSVLTKPNLALKVKAFKTVLNEKKNTWLTDYDVDYYMMLSGADTRVPTDVKVRINIKDQDRDFLGLYGQIVTNEVNGKTYPYFYVVLVAKKGFGLEKAFQSFAPPRKITKEFKIDKDVEVFVIRQATTRRSGYHTNKKVMSAILMIGVGLTAKVAVRPR